MFTIDNLTMNQIKQLKDDITSLKNNTKRNKKKINNENSLNIIQLFSSFAMRIYLLFEDILKTHYQQIDVKTRTKLNQLLEQTNRVKQNFDADAMNSLFVKILAFINNHTSYFDSAKIKILEERMCDILLKITIYATQNETERRLINELEKIEQPLIKLSKRKTHQQNQADKITTQIIDNSKAIDNNQLQEGITEIQKLARRSKKIANKIKKQIKKQKNKKSPSVKKIISSKANIAKKLPKKAENNEIEKYIGKLLEIRKKIHKLLCLDRHDGNPLKNNNSSLICTDCIMLLIIYNILKVYLRYEDLRHQDQDQENVCFVEGSINIKNTIENINELIDMYEKIQGKNKKNSLNQLSTLFATTTTKNGEPCKNDNTPTAIAIEVREIFTQIQANKNEYPIVEVDEVAIATPALH